MIALLQTVVSLGLSLAPTHSSEFYENRVEAGIRFRPCITQQVCAHVGYLLAKDNAVPFLQRINDGDSLSPAGSSLTHWAVGIDARPISNIRFGTSLLRTQRELSSSEEQSMYYVAVAAQLEYIDGNKQIKVERILATPKQWKLGTHRTLVRAQVLSRAFWGSASFADVAQSPDIDGTDFITTSASMGWKFLYLSIGNEALPQPTGQPILVKYNFIRLGTILVLRY